MTIKRSSFEAIYSKVANKVYIRYEDKKVINIIKVDEFYNIEGKSDSEIAEMVLDDNYSTARAVVGDYLLER